MIGTGRLPPISIRNTLDNAYLSDTRRLSIDPETDIICVEKLVDDIWQPAAFEVGADSLWAGKNVAIAGIGHHLAIELRDGHKHFHAHSEYDGQLTTDDMAALYADYYAPYIPVQPDESEEWTGKIFDYVHHTTSHALLKKLYIKIGVTVPTDTIRLQVWRGIDDTGILTFDQKYPASDFTANTEIGLILIGDLEFDIDTDYLFRYSSGEDFSLKTDSTGTQPTLAIAFSRVREDRLLQTKQWVDGNNFEKEQYLIRNRKIYICNTTGTQSGTFASNSALWDLLSSVANDFWTRAGTTLSPADLGDSLTLTGYVQAGDEPHETFLNPDLTNTAGYFISRGVYNRDPESNVLTLGRDGKSGSSWGGVVRFDMGQYESSIAAKVRLNIKLNENTMDPRTILTLQSDYKVGINNGTPSEALDVTGNILASGTIAGTLKDGVIATTQSAGDDSTKVATTAYVDSAVAVEDLWDLTTGTLQNKAGAIGFIFNDGTGDRIEANATMTRLLSPGTISTHTSIITQENQIDLKIGLGSRVLIDTVQTKIWGNSGEYINLQDGIFTFNDGTNIRISSDVAKIQLASPDASAIMNIRNDDFEFYTNSSQLRLEMSTAETKLLSPDGLSYFHVTNNNVLIKSNTKDRIVVDTVKTALYDANQQIRVKADQTETELTSYDGIKKLSVNNNGVKITGLPTSDPVDTGALWNDSGAVKISAG